MHGDLAVGPPIPQRIWRDREIISRLFDRQIRVQLRHPPTSPHQNVQPQEDKHTNLTKDGIRWVVAMSAAVGNET